MNRTTMAGRVLTRSLPAPTGGWNARDMLAEMKPDEAWVLDNFIPDTLGLQQRRGYAEHATGLAENFVETLMEYSAESSSKFFAATPTKITEVSSSGAVGSADLSSLHNGRWQSTMFSTPGGIFLVACNGEDDVRVYDGSSWSTPSISGVTSSTLVNVTSHMGRLWFIRDATLKVYYLDTEAIAGTATEIDFSPICERGGQLVAMASWSRDGGSGLDDFAIFVTSKGQILIYQGIDPSSASTWGLVGKFNVPNPVGHRCFIKLGADLCFFSSQGIMPLPAFLSQSSAGQSKLAVTNKISGAFRDACLNGASMFGWQVLEYAKENLLIANIPIRERAVQYQYVMNLRNGSWCRFTGLNAGCWGQKDGDLYFGGNLGKVLRYGPSGVYDDNGSVISALACQAFNDFRSVQKKTFKSARAILTGPSGYVPQVKLLMDYKHDSLPTFSPSSFTEIGPPWDETDWDVAEWGASQAVTNYWRPVSGAGVVASVCLASAVTTPLTWNQTDVQFEVGRTQ